MSPVFGIEFGHEIGAPANKFTIAKTFSQSEFGSKLESKLGSISDSGFSAVNLLHFWPKNDLLIILWTAKPYGC